LTDYEVRDLNDDINKLLREKRHWENQIVALGGANYRRNVAMLDDDGKEVPGTKGYKYGVTGLTADQFLTPFPDILVEQRICLESVSFSKAGRRKKRKKIRRLRFTKNS
jgi:hypothetical protein